jgi:hypothetical protein
LLYYLFSPNLLPPKSSYRDCAEATKSWNNRRQNIIHEQAFGKYQV